MTASAVVDPGGRVPDVPDVPPHVLKAAVELYLDVHAHPELSRQESRTGALLADWLEDAGYDVTRGVGGHGVVGVLRRGDGPTVLLRAELDALPVEERTGLPYASTVPGVMHACGHDLHLAAMAGAASVLAARDDWRGTLMVVGQPAEEDVSGARAMFDDGLYARFGVPDVALAQHTAPIPAGTLAYGNGPIMAGSTAMDVVMHGRGGHAGAPDLTVDPVVAAAAAVMRLQTVVSRETAPEEQAVLTVGSLHAGERHNVVPDSASMSIALRSFSAPTLARMEQAVERIVRAECDASGAPRPPEFTVTSRSPVLEPHADTMASLRQVHERLFGPERVLPWPGSGAAEDFPWFGPAGAAVHGAESVRTAYWMLGVTSAEVWRAAGDDFMAVPVNHAPDYAPDVRNAMPTGIAAMTAAALHELEEEPGVGDD